jgi:hypothetical protein
MINNRKLIVCVLIALCILLSSCTHQTEDSGTPIQLPGNPSAQMPIQESEQAKQLKPPTITRRVFSPCEYVVFEQADKLIDFVDVILSGEVIGKTYEVLDTSIPDPSMPTVKPGSSTYAFTIYEIAVDQTYKGEHIGDTYKIRILGGKAADANGKVYWDVDEKQPTLKVGRDYLFLACTYDGDTNPPGLVSPYQGAYDLKTMQSAGPLESFVTVSDIYAALGNE